MKIHDIRNTFIEFFNIQALMPVGGNP